MAQIGSMADSLGDKVFGPSDGLQWGVSKDQVAEQRGGKGTTCAVGGVGFDVFSSVPVHLSRGQEEKIGGLRVFAGGGDDVQMRVPLSQRVGSSLGLGESLDWKSGQL